MRAETMEGGGPLIGIVIALPTEWRYFRRAFDVHHEHRLNGHRHYTGRFGRASIAVILSGVGKKNAAHATRLLCEAHRLSAILSIGYAGALDMELKRGDIVLSSFSRNDQETKPTPADEKFSHQLRGVADESHEHHVYLSPLYTADQIVARHEDKQDLFRETGIQIVDMESFSVYSEARARGIPFLGVHAVTDTAEEDIPALEIITPFLMSNSLWRYPRIFWQLATRPRYVVDLALLNHDAQVAGERLTHFLVSNQASLGRLLGAS
jgi:adenosylhomocysteine nucleosidase